jgi:NADH-quinone oxidoreductase subunit N
MFSGLASIIVGCFGALVQKRIKRFIAYASVNQLGFALLSLSCGTFEGLFSGLYFILIYIVIIFGFFAVIMNLQRTGTQEIICDIVYIRELQNLSKKDSKSALILGVLLFSMAGVPPLAGFFAKLNVLLALVKSSFFIVTILLLLISVISLYYYAQIVRYMFFENVEYIVYYYYDYNVYLLN